MTSLKKRTVTWKLKDGTKRSTTRWQARYYDDAGERHTRSFDLQRQGQDWLDEQTAKLVAGTHVAPRRAKVTVNEWTDTWLEGYGRRRESTVRQAEVHLKHIRAEFGRQQLSDVRPSQVKAWCARLKAAGHEDSYIYALHARLAQLYYDAIEDRLVAFSPCSRKTAPPAGKQKPYVATEEQLWGLYDAVDDNVAPAILTGAFLGTRISEAGGLMIADLDLIRGIWTPTAQYPSNPLKSACSKWPVAFGQTLALELAVHIAETKDQHKGEWLLANQWGDRLGPRSIQRAISDVRSGHAVPPATDHAKDCTGCLVPGLPEGFSYHDLRHYYASMLIADGADVKKVQYAMRHASAKTTLDTYSHLWPDSDDAIRSAGDRALGDRLKARDERKRPGGTP